MWWHSSISGISANSGVRSSLIVPGAWVTQVNASTRSPTAEGSTSAAYPRMTPFASSFLTRSWTDGAAIPRSMPRSA